MPSAPPFPPDSMPEPQYDVFIIGGGQAGIPLAHALAKAGRSIALAERKHLGGSCVNFGCTPTKAAIASARVAHLARRGQEFGLRIPTVEVDFAAVLERARGIALESRNSLNKGLEKSDNPKLIRGHARIDGRDGERFRISVGDRHLTARMVVLNTGTRSAIPHIAGLDQIDYLTAENWLDHPELPEHLAMIGAGYIGLEMGQFYRRMGSRVTIWQEGPRVVDHEDDEISAALQGFLEAEGIEFHLNAKIDSIAQLGAMHVFVAVGREPNTHDLGLETVGVDTNVHGYVKVDPRLKTNVDGIWAAGDIRGGPLFTHTSWDDYRILLSQIAGNASRTTERVVPYAVFTEPELGRVGLTERAAREKGLRFRVARFEMKRNGKAREIGEPEGFIKVVVEEGTAKILGAAVLAADGAELVHMYIDMMNAGASADVIRDAVHIHPTLAEAVQSAVS
jgi:pyruvate/2-oxoglutarate dehydrogenase complex dihydrolipoamide dehydrogenase (E3) component